jgi:hypothetical protein
MLVVSERGFYQHYYFDTITDTSNVNYLYPFMLIFANTADRWMVGLEDTGILSGTFPGGAADIYSLQKDKLIFLAVFDEKSHLATVCLPAQAYKTYQAKGNFFNDRKYDNKYYCKVSPSKKIGEKFEYQMTMKCVDATIDNFEQITTDAVKVMQENAK